MNNKIIENYSKLKASVLYLPLFLLVLIALILYQLNALQTDAYVEVQKDWFYYLNSKLSQFPSLQYNLTQFGDALTIIPLIFQFAKKDFFCTKACSNT